VMIFRAGTFFLQCRAKWYETGLKGFVGVNDVIGSGKRFPLEVMKSQEIVSMTGGLDLYSC